MKRNERNFLPVKKYYEKVDSLTKSPSEVNKSGMKILKSNWIGSSRWIDSKTFDDYLLLNTNMHDYKISKIKIWYDHRYYFILPDINGIQFTFKNLITNELVETEPRMGDRSMDGFQEFELDDKEYIVKVDIRSGWIVDCLMFSLNNGRIIKVGGTGGGPGYYDIKDNSVILGSYGSYGTNLYQFGLFTTSIDELKLHRFRLRRLPFLLIKNHFSKKREELEEKIKNLEISESNYMSEIAFAKSCFISKNLFVEIMKFIY